MAKKKFTEIGKVELCAKYLVMALLDTNAGGMTIDFKGFSPKKGVKKEDFVVTIKKVV